MKITIGMAIFATLAASQPHGQPTSNSIKTLKNTTDCAMNDAVDGISSKGSLFIIRFSNILLGLESDLGNSTATADALLDTNFIAYSDSLASVQGKELESENGETIAFLKDDYLDAEALKREYEGVTIWTTDQIAGCDRLVWQWEMDGYGNGQLPVRGFHSFLLERDPIVGLRAESATIEFNTIAALLNGGGGVVYPDRNVVVSAGL